MFEVCGKGKAYQARAILRPEIFEEYICENFSSEDPLKFSLNLAILMDCLTLFGPSTDNISTTMTYSVSTITRANPIQVTRPVKTREGFFKLSLEEAGVLTTCEVTCLEQHDDRRLDEVCASRGEDRGAICESTTDVCSVYIYMCSLFPCSQCSETTASPVDSFYEQILSERHFTVTTLPCHVRVLCPLNCNLPVFGVHYFVRFFW